MGIIDYLALLCKPKPAKLSQYSNMPRFYTIDGTRYDIDEPSDINKLPLIKSRLNINGELYGMDAILMEHGRQAYEKNIQVHQAAISKANQYRYNGIVNKSKQELAREAEWEAARAKRDQLVAERKAQCDSFTIKDMAQFSNIPFGWRWVDELKHTNGVAWFMLNMNNRQIAQSYIEQLSEMILDAHEYVEGISNLKIDLPQIDYDYPVPLRKDSMPNTRVECYPYTKSGKISKYPVILKFSTSEMEHPAYGEPFQMHPISGEIKILKDGHIGSAKVGFAYPYNALFTFGLYGLSLVIKRIDRNGETLFRFDNFVDV